MMRDDDTIDMLASDDDDCQFEHIPSTDIWSDEGLESLLDACMLSAEIEYEPILNLSRRLVLLDKEEDTAANRMKTDVIISELASRTRDSPQKN